MRNILALAAAAVLVFAGVGWYLGWYEVSRTTDGAGHQSITIDVNSEKISDFEHKVHDLVTQKDKKGATQQVTPMPSPPPPPVTPAAPPSIPPPVAVPNNLPMPPPPPALPSTQLPARSDGALVLPGSDGGITPVEFQLPAPSSTPPPPPR